MSSGTLGKFCCCQFYELVNFLFYDLFAALLQWSVFVALEMGLTHITCCFSMFFSIVSSAKEISPSFRALFKNQIIDVHWRTPCQVTRAPVLECVFGLCESVKSWYDLHDKNLAIIHCPVGCPSTGILIACLMKYIGAFEKAEQAYDFYCNRR